MPTMNLARRQFKSRMDAKQDIWRAIPALMGDGNGTIEVPNQPGYVYIRVGDEDLGQAYNNHCPLADNLAIFVGYDPITDPDRRIFQVLSVRMADYAAAGNTNIYPNVAPHHLTHEYGGGDDVYVSWRRLMGLRVGRPALFVVTVDPGYIYRAGAWTEIVSTTVDLTATHAALVGLQAQYILISLSSVGVVTQTDGVPVASPALLTIADCPTPPANHIPLAAVRLYVLQTSIGDTPTAPDIIDLRFPTYNTMSGYVTPHDVLSASHGDTVASAVSRGSLIYGNATPKWEELALGGISGSVLTRNATDVLWSGYALAGTAGQTYTFSATGGTVPTGTGVAGQVAYWGAGNTLTGSANLVFDAANSRLDVGPPGMSGTLTFNKTYSADTGAAVYGLSGQLVFDTTNHTGPIYGNNLIIYASNPLGVIGVTIGLSFSVNKSAAGSASALYGINGAVNNTGAGNVSFAYGAFLRNTATSAGYINQAYGLWVHSLWATAANWGTDAVGIYVQNATLAGGAKVNNQYGIYLESITGAQILNYSIYGGAGLYRFGDQLSIVGSADRQQFLVTGYTTQAAATGLAALNRNDANTNAIGYMLTLANNSTGTAANGFGSRILWNLESSTTADQEAAALDVLWTDATHASRTALVRGQTTGNAANTGYFGHWNYSAVADTAITVIPNAAGDVTELLTCLYAVAEVTGTDTGGGVAVLAPSESYNICSDGTNILTLAVAADGSVTVQRTAGTDTYKVSLWMTWI